MCRCASIDLGEQRYGGRSCRATILRHHRAGHHVLGPSGQRGPAREAAVPMRTDAACTAAYGDYDARRYGRLRAGDNGLRGRWAPTPAKATPVGRSWWTTARAVLVLLASPPGATAATRPPSQAFTRACGSQPLNAWVHARIPKRARHRSTPPSRRNRRGCSPPPRIRRARAASRVQVGLRPGRPLRRHGRREPGRDLTRPRTAGDRARGHRRPTRPRIVLRRLRRHGPAPAPRPPHRDASTTPPSGSRRSATAARGRRAPRPLEVPQEPARRRGPLLTSRFGFDATAPAGTAVVNVLLQGQEDRRRAGPHHARWDAHGEGQAHPRRASQAQEGQQLRSRCGSRSRGEASDEGADGRRLARRAGRCAPRRMNRSHEALCSGRSSSPRSSGASPVPPRATRIPRIVNGSPGERGRVPVAGSSSCSRSSEDSFSLLRRHAGRAHEVPDRRALRGRRRTTSRSPPENFDVSISGDGIQPPRPRANLYLPRAVDVHPALRRGWRRAHQRRGRCSRSTRPRRALTRGA